MNVKPPIGLKPRFIHDIERRIEVERAILRRMAVGYPIPPEWIAEYNELAEREERR